MYRINRGLREWSIDKKLFIDEFKNRCQTFEINPLSVKFYGYQDEDKYIIQYILKEKINDGVFLELGGMDGIDGTNTKTLEDYFNFSGILIEPVKSMYNKMVKNRPNCENHNVCISNQDAEYVEFMGENSCSGIIDTISPCSYKFIPPNQRVPYMVRNKKIKDIIKDSKFSYIDIMSIDVEGGELEVLKSTDFSVPIYCIIIEAHSTEQDKNKIFGDYLKEKGFVFHERARGNEIWFNPNYFRRHLFKL